MTLQSRLKKTVPERLKKIYRRVRPRGLRLYLKAFRYRKALAATDTYCMFVGYGRSGHSLLGQFINAHRAAVIAHEAHALRYLQRGYGWRQIYALLLERDEKFARRGRRWNEYKYSVPGLSQGRHDTLKVIGDKKGGGSTALLAQHPEVFDLLRNSPLPLRVIHHVRHPYDNISSIARREDRSLDEAVRKYFRWAGNAAHHVERFEQIPEAHTIETHHEDLVRNPEQVLARICRFLKLEVYEKYLTSCADEVFESPRQSRDKVDWSADQREVVGEQAEAFPFLRRYEF